MAKSFIQKANYDSLNDVLYLTLNSSRGRSYADAESPLGIEILRDIDTDEITGFVIYYAEEQERVRQKELQEIGWDVNLSDFCRAPT